MRRRTFLTSAAAVLAVTALSSALPTEVDAARSPRTGAADLFVVGTDQDMGLAPPSLHRVSPTGQVLWSEDLEGLDEPLFLGFHSADRNIAEDAFYLYVSTAGTNLLDGMGQLRRYDGRGQLTWAIGVEGIGSEVTVSADPVHGGAFVATSAGISRIDKRGAVLWGPSDFGLGVDAGHWGVAVDTSDGSAWVTAHGADDVLRVLPDGTVVSETSLPEPSVPMFSPLDHGVYVGSGDYGRDTYKLSRRGRIDWVRQSFPSSYTYGRAVNPVDGSLYITSGWDARVGRLGRDGRILADVYLNGGWGGVANQGLAASLDGRYLYTGNSVDVLGIDSYSLSWSSMTLRWHWDPQWYAPTDNVYSPFYRPFVGMPRVP